MNGLNPIVVSLIGFCITLAGTLATVLWKGSAVITRLEKDLEHQTETFSQKFDALNKAADKLESRFQTLESIPDIQRRVGQLESFLQGNVTSRIETLWLKIMSSDKHIAVIEARSPTGSGPAVQPASAQPHVRPPSYPELPPLGPPPRKK